MRCGLSRRFAWGTQVDHNDAYRLISVYQRPTLRSILGRMRILPISQLKSKINEYVDAVAQTRDQITITKNGAPAAVLIGVDEWESIQETLHWLSQPGVLDSVATSEADVAAGRTYGEADIRSAYNVPRQTR